MTHYHEHHCFHDLRYCSICDRVYCTKCNKEWGNYYYYGQGWGNSTYSSGAFSQTTITPGNLTTGQVTLSTDEPHAHQEQSKD